MPLHASFCTKKITAPPHLRDDLRLGTLVLGGLRTNDALTKILEVFRLARHGGHGARPLFALAVVFLLAGREWGIRPFIATFKQELRRRVAPIAGLRALPSSSALSRALQSLTHPWVRGFLDGLLIAPRGLAELLRTGHVQHRDSFGQGWHVLDIDPTIEPFRQRVLPEGPDLPPAERRAVGVPGYTGHKRGEIRIRHIPVQHAGAGIWLAYRLDAAGGSILPLLAEVVSASRRFLRPGCCAERIVVRADGEFGSVGAMRTVLTEGVDVLTRLSRYALLSRADVASAMAQAVWRPVRSTGAGPARHAADLGLFELHPSEVSAEADGGPVTVRVVVTRFARKSEPDHGVLRDGFQIELFATSLSVDAWPAESVVELYFGRGAIENRFAQEDREFGIDRTFSFHPPGQEWMSGIALFLWNQLIVSAVQGDDLPEKIPPQEVRPVEAATPGAPPPPPILEEDVAPATNVAVEPVGNQEDPHVVPTPVQTDSLVCTSMSEEAIPFIAGLLPPEPVAQTEEPIGLRPPASEPGGTEAPAAATTVVGTLDDVSLVRRELWSITRHAFTDLSIPRGWTADDERMEFRCPNNKALFVFTAETKTTGSQNRLSIRSEAGACDGCPVRAGCTASNRPNWYRQLSRSLPTNQAARAQELLRELVPTRRTDLFQNVVARRRQQEPVPTSPTRAPGPCFKPLPPSTPGPYIPASPLFLPAAGRAWIRSLARGVCVEVQARTAPATAPPAHRLIAAGVGQRQHRRLSWAEHERRHGADPITTLQVTGPWASTLLRATGVRVL